MRRSATLKILSALAVLSLLVGAGVLALRQPRTAHAAATITLNGATTLQPIDGFGFSEAFGQAGSLESMSSGPRQQVLNLLFSPTSGAGFTILRNLLPSDSGNTIEPNSPGSPNTPPSYRSLGDSEGQVWMAQQAKSFGVPYLYGDAWSAPGYMKTNGTENNGGTLCGAPGAGCSSGDWRQAYANYLVQYAKDYQSAGVPLTELGAFNELNYTTNYSSMIMNPQQASDFIGVLGPTVRNAGLNLQVVCCDVLGWDSAQSYASALGSNGSDNIFSSHGYGGAPTFALTGLGSRHMWETEWSTFDGFNTNWDDGSDASGYTWAQSIYTGLTAANLSAFLYWWGASNGSDNQGLIQFNSGSYTVSARLWAFAQYSRFIRPGAVHVGTSTTDSNLMTFAARNSDGSYAIVVLNANRSDTPATFALQNAVSSGTATPYVTNGANSVAQQGGIGINGGSFSATIPARSLVTYRISGSNNGNPTPTSTPGSGNPTPTPVSSGSTGVLRGVQSNRCLDVPNVSQNNGTFLDIWDCNGGSNQQWTALSNGELQVYGSKCLDVPNHATSAGTRVEIWDCNGGANQQWNLNSDGTVVGRESNLCLDVTGQGTANGTQVEIWTCNGGSNQKWSRS